MHKSLIAVLLLSLLIFADGFFYSAHAQCSAWDKIYIDPRLVPKQLKISWEQLGAVLMASDSQLPPEIKSWLLQQYTQQGQTIMVPYGTGKVLVDPTNSCIQQYIP